MSNSSAKTRANLASVDQLAEFDTIIDARSPSEFAEDHLPGAISCPVLDDAQRAEVGTLYKQVSPFAARRVGAVLVAKNVARWIETYFMDRPREWKPLVYCWRGGQRSGAFTHILREVGWNAHRLEGGYKAWRRHVIEQLEIIPKQFRFQVISGATGSAKSRILEAMGEQGAQILHLEQLACHKGSVLGNLPSQPQPAQKGFESQLFAALSQLDPSHPVFVEAESRKIGQLHLPEALIMAIRQAPCIQIEATLPARVAFLLNDYHYAITDPHWLLHHLGHLRTLQSRETLNHWQELVQAGNFPQLVTELLEQHYDPLYHRSQQQNYVEFGTSQVFATDTLDPSAIAALAQAIRQATSNAHGELLP
jgi:tRNA 2-selenouridine synthase